MYIIDLHEVIEVGHIHRFCSEGFYAFVFVHSPELGSGEPRRKGCMGGADDLFACVFAGGVFISPLDCANALGINTVGS